MKHQMILDASIMSLMAATLLLSSEPVRIDANPLLLRETTNAQTRLAHQNVNAQCFVQMQIETFAAPEFSPDLVSLRLYNCTIRDLASIRVLKHLQELEMRNCSLKDISPIRFLTTLSRLSLADNEITNVAPLSACRSLKWLDLRHNRIGDVSSLRVLDKLVRLDLRGNLIDADFKRSDIHLIKKANPDAKILSGPEPNTIQGRPLPQVLSAKAVVADFALAAGWDYQSDFPRLPPVSSEVAEAFLLLREAHDAEYVVDVSIVLLRYAIDILATTHAGTLLSTDNPNPLLTEFLRFVPRRELAGDEITTGAIAYWVYKYRDKMPPSVVLDAYIDRYRQVEKALDDEWKALK